MWLAVRSEQLVHIEFIAVITVAASIMGTTDGGWSVGSWGNEVYKLNGPRHGTLARGGASVGREREWGEGVRPAPERICLMVVKLALVGIF